MSAGEREGVIKFGYEKLAAEPVAADCLAGLGAWRSVLRRLGVLGADPGRYGGYGFGNVSYRAPGRAEAGGARFFISGSQTGHLERLGSEHWVEVTECDPERNFLRARGIAAPSAEAMTHAAVYAQDPRIRCVLHGHSPEIFAAAARLGLPQTGGEVEYGTPAMAREVARLFRDSAALRRLGCFVMAGHEDGVVAFGRDAAQAGGRLVATLARALS